ncbi:Uncharacterized protein BP5553_05489 [Venustampulla echinocandica]|uniref:Uncharacterized protein n=1 Tax=Venustampulla echinocandica TaxID=2656787 RepID=A0A370TR96_9HELO|nr:Uncharacterized protein BP5553_05489 [Venustampulla echinocandica]RDL38056.1 Uncharacterized protein BP5553_05489 [Venustampulla echinocandica]
MDLAYNHPRPYARHHNRSLTSPNHLTLAPLTSRLPLSDPDALPDFNSSSYIEGRSAPTTPSILSRSSSRVSLCKPAHLSLSKSKSSTHLLAAAKHKQARSVPSTPRKSKLGRSAITTGHDAQGLSEGDRNDSDWLLRAGAAISSSTRESKGQAWLVSRASSTSLTAQRDEEEEQFEHELARERMARDSRRGSVDADDEFSPITRRSLSFSSRSRPGSRFASRANSRRGSRAVLTPLADERDGYFDVSNLDKEGLVVEPDFVDVDEEEFEDEGGDEARMDEAVVRNLARASSAGLTGWVERMLGWSLFAVDEDDEDPDVDVVGEKTEETELSSRLSRRHLRGGMEEVQTADVMPALRDDDAGGWQDAAWLLSVATRVLL